MSITEITTVITALILLLTFAKAVLEYIRRGKQSRAERFFQMREKYISRFADFFVLFGESSDAEELKAIPYRRKLEFLDFFEELALMINSRLIDKRLAYYMFGWATIKCWESDNFWKFFDEKGRKVDITKNQRSLSLFAGFAKQMIEVQNKFKGKSQNPIFRIK